MENVFDIATEQLSTFKETKELVLELLYDKAREWSEREKNMLSVGQNELSQFFAVRRLVDFAVQDIINRSRVKSELDINLEKLSADLHNDMIFYRDNRISHVADLQAVAYVAFCEIESIIKHYLG